MEVRDFGLVPMKKIAPKSSPITGVFGSAGAYVQGVRIILAISVLVKCCRTKRNEDGIFDYQVGSRNKSVAKAKVIQLILDLSF